MKQRALFLSTHDSCCSHCRRVLEEIKANLQEFSALTKRGGLGDE